MPAVARLVGLEAVIDVEAVAEVHVRVVFDEDGGLAGLHFDGGAIEPIACRDQELIAIGERAAVERIGDFYRDLERAGFQEADGHAGGIASGFEDIGAGGRPGSVAVEDALDGRRYWVFGRVGCAGYAHAGQAVDDFVVCGGFGDAHGVRKGERRAGYLGGVELPLRAGVGGEGGFHGDFAIAQKLERNFDAFRTDHVGALRIDALGEIEVDDLGGVGHAELFLNGEGLDGGYGGG